MSTEGKETRDTEETLHYINGTGRDKKESLSKHKRGRLKGRITIGLSQIATLRKQKGSQDAVSVLVKKLHQDFETFRAYHEKLHETFQGSESEIKCSERYFQDVETLYLQACEETERWLETPVNMEEDSDDYLSAGEEEEQGHEQGVSRGLGAEASSSVPGGGVGTPSGQLGDSTADRTLRMLEALSERMTAMEKQIGEVSARNSSRGENAVVTSSPARGRPRSRLSFGGMTTIAEENTGESDSLSMLRSMAESFQKLAERKQEPREDALLSMAESFKAIAEKTAELSVSSASATSSYKLPKFNLFQFSGHAIDYVPFIRAYESQVESKHQDPTVRLGALIQHTKGDLQELLKCCVVKDSPEEAYRRAREILTERYGRFEDLAQAWLDRFAGIAPVKTTEELLKLNSMLLNCKETLAAVKQLKEFETKSNLMVVIHKLPRFMKTRWQEKVVDIQETQGRSARLDDLINITRRVYREKSDPIYGGALSESSPDAKYQAKYPRTERRSYFLQGGGDSPRKEGERVNTFGTTGADARPKQRIYGCICCGGQHTLYKCFNFKDMSPPDRLALVEKKGACTNCFHPRHTLDQCHSNYRCQVCKGSHHTMLHIDGGVSVNLVNVPVCDGTQPQEVVTATAVGSKVALPVVPVRIHGVDGYVDSYALLDQGSTCSLVTESIVDRLGLARTSHSTYMTTVDRQRVKISCSKVDLQVQNVQGGDRYSMKGVLTRPTLNLSARCKAYKDEIQRWDHLKHLRLPKVDVDQIDLLIGLSHPQLLAQERTIKGPGELDPYAAETVLGWFVGGPMGDPGRAEHVNQATFLSEQYCNNIHLEDEGALADKLDRLWRIDGINCDPEAKQMSMVDRRVIKEWEEKGIHDGKNYHLPIPFKDRSEWMPNNRCAAVQQLHSLGRRLNKAGNEEFKEQYVGAMLENIRKHAEPVKDAGKPGRTRYLPHLPVFHPRKPGKPRIVFNAASKYGKKSLNDYINSEPDLMNHLLDVLLRWRQDKTTINGDIEGMFNQILVLEEDRDCLRFLFWKDGEVGSEIVEYRMKTHLFGGVWSPSCANWTLKRCADDFGEGFSEEAKRAIRERFYVDDGLNSTSGGAEAVKLYEEIDGILSKGGFNFTKLTSNDDDVLRRLPAEKLAKIVDQASLEIPGDAVDCVLGNLYRPKVDRLVFVANLPDKPKTRRGLLGTVSSIYDPLGLVGPVTLKAKTLFQETCRRKAGWDDPLDDDVCMAYQDWLSSLNEIGSVQFRRCFLPEGLSLAQPLEFELHHFGDASCEAYGAAGYVLILKEGKPVGCSLVMAKGRLAPIRTPPVPRLELTASQAAVQLDLVCKRALDLKFRRTRFWTDSSIVMWYLTNGEKRCMTFVANKVGFILEHSEPDQWGHVPTEMNPADIISRGASPAELADSSLWAHGPAFLMEGEDRWPKMKEFTVDETSLELKTRVCLATCEEPDFDPPTSKVEEIEIVLVTGTMNTPKITLIADKTPAELLLEHFSSWYRLKRATVNLVKFVMWRAHRTFNTVTSVEDLEAAEWGICRYLQKKYIDPKAEKSQSFRKLFPYRVDGLLRVGGRLSRAEIHPDQRNQIVLPPCPPVKAMIWNVHVRLGHSGPQRVQAEILKKYWILHGKGVITGVLSKCIHCKKMKAPFRTPEMSDLHKYRVTGENVPFYNTGVDYFGPIIIRERRVEKKRYGCLFTCLQTRAIHLEVAWSLDLDSCLNAVFRFAARRGMPRNMRSDNGTNFVGGDASLKKKMKEWDRHKIEGEMLQRNCNWTFNTPAASHMGGAWERQIRTVRSLMVSVCNLQQLTEESLLTVFCMIEDMVNNRPLTPVNSDPRDLAALTPNHFLRLNTAIRLPVTIEDEKDAYRRRWLQVQFLCNLYWKRWREEYLVQLQARTKWTKTQRNLKKGDLVVVSDDTAPRNTWPLARVIATYPDERGVVRSVMIVSRRGELRRPVHKLALVEACD